MQLGILGTGMIVADLMQTYDSLPIEKTVLLGTERSREKAERLAQDHGFAQVLYDYDELLASDIDTSMWRFRTTCTMPLRRRLLRQASMPSSRSVFSQAR